MMRDGGISKKTKHFLMLIHYCREKIREGLISIEHVDSEETIADIGSNAIYDQDFIHKRQGLMGLQTDKDAVPCMKRAKKVVKFACFNS